MSQTSSASSMSGLNDATVSNTTSDLKGLPGLTIPSIAESNSTSRGLPYVIFSPEEKAASVTSVARMQLGGAPPPVVVPPRTSSLPSPVADGSVPPSPSPRIAVVGGSALPASTPKITRVPSGTLLGSQVSPTSNPTPQSAIPLPVQTKTIDERLLAAGSTGYRTTTRKKIALAPGHSMMDWYRHCQRKEPVEDLRTYTLEEIATHNRADDMWMILHGRVYDITEYVPYHPGGLSELMRAAGKDGTALFIEAHHFVNFDAMLEKHLVGVVSRTPQRTDPPSK